MSNTRELTEAELDAVSGGGDLQIQKFMDAPSSGGGYVGGGGSTPAGAWNDCLRGYGFPPMA
jgi:hypothetical protein